MIVVDLSSCRAIRLYRRISRLMPRASKNSENGASLSKETSTMCFYSARTITPPASYYQTGHSEVLGKSTWPLCVICTMAWAHASPAHILQVPCRLKGNVVMLFARRRTTQLHTALSIRKRCGQIAWYGSTRVLEKAREGQKSMEKVQC